ncbi:hypothetical protein PS9374_02182 [Planomonospora sphaerica]|uniref:Lipoprotein n=1 Tax=Planomonospora sphaerica TaxID=161355 RepID=A0A171CD88_9ACTN|nr:hypothetical protein [Planomonospora sphaerica]GAT66532.1 hypothetical protein PS9374_02182 [Planomonospora sphaerica]
MRRSIALTAAVLAAPALATATSAAAHAAPTATAVATAAPAPADALKRQFQTGRGVRVTQTAHMFSGKTTLLKAELKGRLEFGPTGPAAYDLAMRMTSGKGSGNDSYRAINVKNRLYASGDAYNGLLPEGKKWVSGKGGPLFLQHPDVLEPVVLAALVKDPSGKHSRDGLRHQGTLTYAELYKLSPGFRATLRTKPTGESAEAEISWRLWLDGKGLPRRAAVSETLAIGKSSLTRTSDTRFSGWGSKVTVTAPPADHVIDEKDLPSDAPEPKELVNTLSSHRNGG